MAAESPESPWRGRYEALEKELQATEDRHQALESVLRRFVLRLTLAARGIGPRLDEVLERCNEAMRRNLGIEQLEPLLSALSNAVASSETPAVAAARSAAAPEVGPELRSALNSVIDRLDIDPSLGERASEVRARIANAVAAEPLTAACTELADLLAAQRERARLEKADVQRILLQVDTRLNEFVSYLRGEAAERKAADASRQALDEQMRGEVQELSVSVQTATDLSTLQSQVRSRLESIDQHLHQFRSRESQRVAEFRERAERMRSRVEQLESETRLLQASLAREQANATTDPLTGIPNRLAYNQRIALEFKRWKRFGRPLCIAVWDIDNFKALNDTHGHAAGDQVIRAFAKALAAAIRETDFIARYGGEEFILLLVDTPLEAALKVIDKHRANVEKMGVSAGGQVLRFTVSAGVAEFAGEDDTDSVFERADRALYRAKQGGRNRCEKA